MPQLGCVLMEALVAASLLADFTSREEARRLTATPVLLTLAVIAVAAFAVVLAALGYFSPSRDDERPE